MKKVMFFLFLTFVLGMFIQLYSVALSEGFESATCPATDWTIRYADPSAGNTMIHSTSYFHGGARSFRFSSYNESSVPDYNQYLITPQLNVTSGDQTISFWYRCTSSGSEEFRVGWSSTDNATASFTWGTAITNASTTWQQFTKTDLPIGTKYVAINYYSDYMYYLYLDDVSGPQIYVANDPEPTNYPSDFAAPTLNYTSITLTWTGSTGTQLPAKYLILAKKGAGTYANVIDGTPVSDDSDWSNNNAAVNVVHAVGANTYTFTGLTINTNYDFVIYPYTNSAENINFKLDGSIPTVSATTLDPTLPIPYTQNFNSGTTLAGINWSGTMGISASHGVSSNGLYYNLYSSATTCNAVSNPIGPLAAVSQLKFDYRIVDYTGYPATGTAIVAGDSINVQVSTDGGTVFTTVYSINSTNHVTGTAFVTKTIDLTAYASNTIIVKFLCKRAAGDYYIDIDNFLVRETPGTPILAYDPTAINFGSVTTGVQTGPVNVTISNTGAGTLNIAAGDISLIGTNADQFSFTTAGFPAVLDDPAESVVIPVYITATTPGVKTATLRIVNNETRTDYDVTLEGRGVTGVVNMSNGTTALTVGAVYGFYDTGGALANYSANENLVRTFTPPPGYLIQADFSTYASEADYDTLFVYNGSSVSSPLLGTYSGEVTVPQHVSTAGALTFKFVSDSGVQDIGWSALISAIPGASGAPEVVRLDYPANLATDLPKAGFSLAWTPRGGGLPDNYGVYLSTDPEDVYGQEYWETTNTSFNPVTEGSYTLNYEGVYYWTVEAFKTGYTSAVQDTFFRFTIEADPAIATFPWFEGFEGTTFPPAGWTMNDADADGNTWFAYSLEATAHTGSKSAASASWTSGSGALTPDNWLISPPINVPAARVDYMLEWYIGAQDAAYPEENYGVYVSTTGTAPADFTEIFTETLPDGLWHYRSQELAAYAGQTIYIAFRHFDCTDQFYMKLDDVQVREVPQVPIFDISPTEWTISDTQLLNPVTKTFTVTNAGIGDITIGAGDIYISDDTEGNFTLTAAGLPVVLGETGVESYSFTVTFIPLTVGAKTATLNIQDNLTARVLHNIALSGTCVEEPTASIIQFTGAVSGSNNVSLAWRKIYGDPGSPSWVHWDSGLNTNSIGAGTSTMDVAVKYDSLEIAGYAGMELTKVKFFLQAFDPAATFSVKVWSGLNGTLAPVTVLVNQAVASPVEGWNEVILASAVPITGLEAIYIGYTVVPGATGYYPAGVDGLAAVANRGNLICLNSGTWTTLASSSIAGNWNIHGYIDTPISRNARRDYTLLHTPVTQRVMTKEELRDIHVSALNTNPERLLRGFNIFRDAVQINTTLVTTYTYTDLDLAAGTYEYTVQAVHYSANGPMSDPVSVVVTYVPPIALPFIENWTSADYATNNWTISSTNWIINTDTGNPTPQASFSWSPAATDYSIPLTSFNFDATGMSSVKLYFDLSLNNYSTDAENLMSVEVWDGSAWNTIKTYSSFDNSGEGWGFGFNSDSYDISAYAANRVFKVRFVAHGENTYEINYWYLDNIELKAMPSTIDAPVSQIALNSTDIQLSWSVVPEADWYAVYKATDANGTYDFVGWLPRWTTGAIVTPATGIIQSFYRVTAGAGPLPAMPGRLSNAANHRLSAPMAIPAARKR